MPGMFDGLEAFGISGYEPPKNIFADPAKQAAASSDTAKKTIVLTDYVFEKTYTCSVCETQFPNYTVMKSKLRFVGSDTDLKPQYDPIDPLYYDVIMCSKCGYTAVSAFYGKVLDRHRTVIQAEITPKYKYKKYPAIMTPEMAIERYKMALFIAMKKNSKVGEKSYLCLKLCWLYRILGKEAEERMFMEQAFNGFKLAYSEDTFPIGGLDEDTVMYMVGEFARRLGYYEEALRWMSNVILKKNINPRLKNRALDMKEAIRQDMVKK